MSARGLAHATVTGSIACGVGALFWIWGELNWKNLGSHTAVLALSLAGALLAAVFAARAARRPTPIDWIFELVRTAMLVTLVSGAGALVAHLGDLPPPGAAPSGFGNNQPKVWTPWFVTLMVASTALATSSILPIWRHRHAVSVHGERPLGPTLVASGAWLSSVAVVLALVGAVTEVDLAHPFAPLAALALALLVLAELVSLRLERARFDRTNAALATTGGALAIATLVLGLTGFPLVGRDAHRDANACRAVAHPGLFLDARASRVTAYRGRGVALRRVECRTTFQYNDERHIVVVGRDEEGQDLQGPELFLRVVGTPLERARAACEILLSERCEAPLSYPSEIAGIAAGIPERGVLVPHERGGRLAFFAVTHDYPNGRATTVGRRRTLVGHEVDLGTGRLVEAR